MRKRRWVSAAILIIMFGACACICCYIYWFDLFPRAAIDDGDYPMQPVPINQIERRMRLPIADGQRAWWKSGPDNNVIWVAADTNYKTIPHGEVKAYPELKSRRALYGAIDFGKGSIKPGSSTAYYFVVDESQGTGRGYDRLYFDMNHDLDLTNDPQLGSINDSPNSIQPVYSWWGKNIVFPALHIPFDFGPDYGTRPVEILPRLCINDDQHNMFFVASEARRGTIQIGARRFQAILMQSRSITGRYDDPGTELYLCTNWVAPLVLVQRWWGDEYLSSFRLVDGKLYKISVTPSGERLMVRCYRGKMGVLRIEAGNRDLTEVCMSGSLSSEKGTVPIGKMSHYYDFLEKVGECEAPEDDYFPEKMQFRYGRLAFWLTNNYHTDGVSHGAKKPVYAIKIRKDRPFVLDFSNRPEVMFVSPAKDRTFKRGDEVEVKAVLTDPVLGAMIRGLDDTSRKMSRKIGETTIEQNLSLEPTVTIADSSGKIIAEGKMHFG
ncbi:MAG: hypothetical protein ABSE63_09240 [Thermoguttaceae bacterium]